MGNVSSIYISPSADEEMSEASQVALVAGRGIVGDRYYNETGTFSERLKGKPAREATFIEREEINHFNGQFGCQFGEGEFRRNIVTTGIRLNDLVGKQFRIGDVLFRGIQLCEPCAYLQKIMCDDVVPGLVGKGGLRAAIVEGGDIFVGDEVVVV